MNPLQGPLAIGSTVVFAVSELLGATSPSSDSSSNVTLYGAAIGAIGLVIAAVITAILQRRNRADPGLVQAYEDARRDLAEVRTELHGASGRIDRLEETLRMHGIEVPE